MRRAYSVCDQNNNSLQESESEGDIDNSPSVAGEYARRNGSRVVARVDGSPGFKPMRSSIAITGEESGASGKSPYGPGGMPGFGDHELEGKILPCHKVKEDGLVRITADTVSLPWRPIDPCC